ncbi:hypothetical protein D3C78_1704790 [compost metagenome]
MKLKHLHRIPPNSLHEGLTEVLPLIPLVTAFAPKSPDNHNSPYCFGEKGLLYFLVLLRHRSVYLLKPDYQPDLCIQICFCNHLQAIHQYIVLSKV